MTADTYEFKTETRQLLDLVIHSLYTNKEIFLRELISNASDALDRLRFEALTDPQVRKDIGEPEIRLETDSEARSLTITDNGIGMSREELVENIGTIAHSGWREMVGKVQAGEIKELPPEFIGQFGVGFYSSFMVAQKVSLVTRRAGEKEATRWESAGDGTYDISDAQREECGTSITLHLRPVDSDDGLEDFTSEHVLGRIVKQYSDFVTYPIKLEVHREQVEEGEPKEAERTISVEDRTLNSMKALWERPQSEVKEEEYRDFYRHISHDWNEPLKVIRQRAEGRVEYDALLFIPSKAPHELFYKAYESGLQLFVKNVKIIEQCKELIPHYLRFVKGVVDCKDVPLNVSRETLQHTRELSGARKAVTKKILDTLGELQKEPESYLAFWHQFGRALKEGVGEDHDNRDKLTKLLMFQSSSHPTELTTLTDYVSRMKEGQEEIYYITGESRVIVENQPVLEAFKDKGYEVLYLIEPVDELVLQYLPRYDDKRLKSVGKGTVDLGDEKEKEEAKKEREDKEKQYAPLFELIQKRLESHVKQVRLSSRLTSSAVCLVGAEHDYSPQLEKLLLAGKGGGPKQRRILEINLNHPLLGLMQTLFEANENDPLLSDCADLLFGQGLLTEGSELPDPVRFSHQVADLMVRALR